VWVDPEFPPELSSLIDPEVDTDASLAKYEQFEWKRVGEIYDEPSIFCDGIEPNDIQQGALGDCYFLAVLSSMAEDPEDIKALFETKEINDAGIYLMFFFINGVKTPVIVDDHLPSRHGRPAFASSQDGEVWVSLLEKAWAKLHGTYARTEGGLPCFANSHLTGVPTETVRHKELETAE